MSADIIKLDQRRPVAPPLLSRDQFYLATVFAAPAYKALPFVTMKHPEDRTGGFSDASSYWNDVPTDDNHADYKRGISLAQQAIAAIQSDQALVAGFQRRACPRGLELTVQHLVEGAVRRRQKGGRYSRSLTSCEQGFLTEIAKVIYEAAAEAKS